MALPIESEKELSVGGFQGIKKIRGLLMSIDVQDPPETWENREKQVVVVKMEDTTVIEMFGDEDIFELKEGKFSFYIPYVEAGKAPHQNSIYSRCWLASAKELGKKPSEFIGQYVTLEKQPRVLFQKPILEDDGTGKKEPKLDEDGKKILGDILAVDQSGRPNHFCFVKDDLANPNSLNEYVKSNIVGLNQRAALRVLISDNRIKTHPEYKDALNNGTLATMLGVVLVEDKFQEVKKDAVSSSQV